MENAHMGLFKTTTEWDEALAAWQGIQDLPAKENRKRRNGFKVLENDFLEKYFATSHWAMPGLWFIPIITVCLWLSATSDKLGAGQIVGFFVAGVLGWTFVEYWLHRWFFHLPPGKSQLRRTILFIAHGYHHEFPNDPGRLVAPPVLSWPLATVIGLLCWLSCGVYWHAVFGGICAGYLAYDWMHYYTHHGRPKTRMGKFMRRFHQEHHFKNHDTQFGLSSPLWDVVLGTFRKPTEPERAEIDYLKDKPSC